MFSQDKQFRRPDGTLYDPPSSFNVRQYEEQYGPPGGVPEGYSMGAITPVQSLDSSQLWLSSSRSYPSVCSR